MFCRTALFSIVVVLLTLTAFGLRLVVHEAKMLRANLQTQAKLLTISLDRVVSNALAKGQTQEALNQCLDTLRVSRQAAYIGVTDGSGKTWLQTQGGTTVIDNADDGLGGLLPSESGAIVYSSLMRQEVLHYHHPLTRLPNAPGSLQVGLKVGEYRDAMRQMHVMVLGLAVPGLLIGVLSSFLFARYLTRPISHLEGFAVRVAGGKLDARVEIESGTEIGRLAAAMNTMTAEIERSQLALQQLVDLEKLVSAAGAELTKLDAEGLEKGIEKVLRDVVEFLGFEHYALIQASETKGPFSGSCHNIEANAGTVIATLHSVCYSTHRSMRSERRAKDYFACFIALRPDAKAPHGVLALPMGNAQVPWGIICFLHNAKAAPSENEVRILLLLGRIIHNLVQRRCGERERLRLLQSLNRTQKLEAIGTLSGGIAHDFNNMLVPIIGYSDVILNHADELSGHRQKIIEIRKAAESAASLTKQLLAFSQMQILQKQSIHLNEAIERLRESLQRLVGERICLRMVLDPGLWVIEADLPQIEQVLVNVCSNARDAMPGGGEIRIGTQNVRLEAATDDEPSGNFVTLCVEDNGTGIEKDRMDRIFDPFYSSKEQPGAGLGLSVVLGIIEQHGGWIHVESEVGLGSRFLFYLPANKGVGHPGSRGTAWAEADSLLGARQPRLLVIEDEPSVLAFVTQALSRVGYDVTTASSFATALAVYERHGGRFDLVFSDVVLPDGTGMEIVDRIRARHPEQRVLLSSAYTNARALLDRIVERRIPFLHKPYSLETLYRKVKEALQADMLVGERQRD